ncbi:hypothetical protein BKP35_16445 [Anaerobacillus arseniciselenatis]|uniref:M23ase beta-sheet core domain-containing protein n=2 Tax=Anaerobacillus arseniciselenatis TaxID=85682 RepID=A0A1S2LBN6_9BACI|nr:hypothetical protein BKP35_16445 [Anaerobacillus arseniciselenatis]
MNIQQGIDYGKQQVKKYIKKKITKAIILALKKILLKLVFLIIKAFLAAMAALTTVLGLPTVIILAILIIIGGAMFLLAPTLGLIDDDSPISQQEVRSELETLIFNSSDETNYRPPIELVSSIDMMRIIQEDLNPWDVNFSPIVETLSPDLTYQDFEDTYEVKIVTTTTKEVTKTAPKELTYEALEEVGKEIKVICSSDEFNSLPFELVLNICYQEVPVYDYVTKTKTVLVPIVEVESDIDTSVKLESKKVTFLKNAHSWNRYETYYYKEVDLNNSFKLVDVIEEGNKKVEVYKRKTKEWIFDAKDFEHDYTKFDEVLINLELENSSIMLLVEALKENNIPLDGYKGHFFDIFLNGGMRMMITQKYMEIYKKAEETHNIPWYFIAAAHYVETKFFTLSDEKSNLNVLEIEIFLIAQLLSENDFENNNKEALRKINPTENYVADVIHFAALFKTSQGALPPIAEGIFTRPAIGPLTSDYGHRWGKIHHGVDIGKSSEVVPIVASADGIVSRSYFSSSYGETIFIKHNINGEVWETVYAHMASGSRRVQVHDHVSKGQVIGLMGNTGRSKGAHLHFEIHNNGGWNSNKTNSISPTKSGLIEW